MANLVRKSVLIACLALTCVGIASISHESTAVAAQGGKKKKGKRGKFNGHGVGQKGLRTEPLPRPSGWVHVTHPGLHEEVRVNIYKADGSLDEASLAALDAVFRCRRTKEVRAVDPRLYEVLSIIYDHFGQKPVQLASGFRYQRNEGSRHFHASAMDVTVKGVSYRDMYAFASTLDRGGMGIGQYPRDGFVHIDFRAPGEPSYRWTDTGSKKGASGRLPSRLFKKRSTRPST